MTVSSLTGTAIFTAGLVWDVNSDERSAGRLELTRLDAEPHRTTGSQSFGPVVAEVRRPDPAPFGESCPAPVVVSSQRGDQQCGILSGGQRELLEVGGPPGSSSGRAWGRTDGCALNVNVWFCFMQKKESPDLVHMWKGQVDVTWLWSCVGMLRTEYEYVAVIYVYLYYILPCLLKQDQGFLAS